MFIKRAKSRPSLRARESDLDPASSPLGQSSVTADSGPVEDVEPESAVGNVMERKKAQKAKRDKRLVGVQSSSGPRLSFGSDAGESFGESSTPKSSRVGKSSLSRNLDFASSPAASPGPSSNYSREYLDQLKAATPSRSAKVETEQVDEDMNGGLSRLAQEKYASLFAEDTTAGIPDAAAVQAAKMKRQAALESAKHGGGDMNEDYIALGGGKLIIRDGQSGPHPESRLMREDDEGDEGDEDLAAYTESSNRLYIGKQANKAAARRLRGEIGEMIAEREADDEESDEETREWEKAQASRAGGRPDDMATAKQPASYVPAAIPRARPPPSLAPAQARILASLQDLNIVKSTGEHDLEVVSTELANLEQQEKDVRRDVEAVEGKREWIEEFKGWVGTLGGFLEEKFPLLEKIEKDSMAHLQERADLVSNRRTADDNDDIALILGVPPQSVPEGDDGALEEVDELGRSRRTEHESGPSSGVRKARRSDRSARRTRRRARTQTANGAATISVSPGGDDEGFSTDSSLAEGDARDYSSAQHDLSRRVDALLDDVKAEDFRDPSKGLAVRFGDWRSRYADEYMGAFGALSMVQAWSFWARGEMVGWEPLRSNTAIEEFTWFQAIHEHSHPRPTTNGQSGMDEDDEPPLGPDGDLNTQMVNDAVVPFLIQAFQNGAYDPYSAKQTRKAVDVLEVVQEMAGKDSRKFTDLLRAILEVFTAHITSLATTISATRHADAIPPPAFDPASRIATLRFIRRRIKLLRNVLLWRRQAPNEVRELIGRIVQEVLVPVLSKAWEGGGKEMAGQVLMASGGLLSGQVVGFLQRGPIR